MKKRIVAIIFILIITFSLNVFAKEKIELNIDKNSVNLGEEITVSINFSKEEQVAYAYTAKLSYDEDVFETISTESFEEQENWSDINYNMNNQKFALINKSGESGKKLVQIKLKVRDEAKQGKTTISVGNVTSTNGEDDISIDGNSVEVQVGNETQDTTPDEIKENNNEKISEKTEKNTYKYFAIIPIVLSILIIAFLIYINTRKDNINENKIVTISILSGIVLLALVIIAIIILRTEKIDTNNDGVFDYNDANKIIDYLLEIENPDEKDDDQNTNNTQLDTNMNGEVSAADIGRVLRSVKNNTKYTPKITFKGTETGEPQSNGNESNSGSSTQVSNNGGGSGNQSGQSQNPSGGSGGQNQNPGGGSGSQGENPGENPKPDEIVTKVENENNKNQGVFQVQDGEQTEFIFDIEITPKTMVKEVVISGKTYLAIYSNEDGLYHVVIPTTDLLANNKTYGKNTVVLTEIILDNGKHLKLGNNKLSLNIEILKQQPTIVGELEYNEADPSVTVTLDDPDNALKDGGYIYLETVDGEGIPQKSRVEVNTSKMEIDGRKKKFTANINEFKNIDGTDSDIKNGDYNFYVILPYQLDEDGILESIPLIKSLKNIHIITDYKFTFSDLKVATTTVNGSAVEDITNDSAKLTFTSTNEAIDKNGLPVTVDKVKVKVETIKGEIIEQDDVTAIPITDTPNQYEIQVEHKGEIKQTISIEGVELSNGRKYIKQSSEAINNDEKTDVLENQKVTIFLNTPVTQSFTLDLGDEQTNITAGYLLQDLDNTVESENVRLALLYKPSQEAQEIELHTITVPTNTLENTVVSFNKIADYKDKISEKYNYNNGNGIYTVKLYATFSRIDGKKHEIQDESGFIGMATTTRNEKERKKAPIVTASVTTKTIPYELTVNVTDTDRAFKTGTVTIKNSDGIVKTENFTSEQTPFKLQLNKEYLENGNYTIEITYTYQEKEGEELKTGSIPPIDLSNFVSDYGVNFEKIDDVTVQKKIEGVQDGNVILKFTATTKTTNFIESIELDDGKTPVGKVTREGNQYTVEIPYESELPKTFRITKLILDNHYAEELDTNRLDTVFSIYLEKPEIATKEDGTQELELMVDDNTKQPIAKVKINNDKNGVNYRARLTYPNSTEVVEIPLTKGNENEYNATFGKLADVAGEYKLEILADYNLADGKGMLQNQVLGTTTYTSKLEAKITNGSIQREQPTKGEIVTITYKIHDNTGKALEYIEVNGNTYKATLAEGLATDNETTYTVDVPVPLKNKKIDEQTGAPIVEFIATKLIYEGEEKGVEIEFAFEQKAQNAKPKYENTFENEDEDANKPRIKFHFTDSNEGKKAFRKATVKLKDSKENVVKTREFTDIDKDYYFLLYSGKEKQDVNGVCPEGIQDTFTEAIEGEIYSIEVEIEYDVEYEVEGQENEAPGTVKDVIPGLLIKGDYNLRINTNQEETKVDAVTGKTTITFTSTNSMNAEIKSVNIEKTVNGNKENLEDVAVTSEGETYKVEVNTDGEEESKHEYNITEVKLKTGVIIKEFEEGSNTNITTHLTTPKATLTTPDISQDGKITTTLNIKDPENILKELKATLYKKQGEQEIWQEEITPTEANTTIEEGNGKDYKTSFDTDCSKAGTYIIKITGNYERVDGKAHTNEVLTNSNVEVTPKVTSFILSANPYVEKNKDIVFNISIQDNIGSTIDKIELIDNKGKTYNLNVISNQATLVSSIKPEEITYIAKTIYFADGTKIDLEESTEHQTKVEVLKDKPQVDYEYDDTDINNPKIIVNVTDSDKALKDNKVTLTVTPLNQNTGAIINQDLAIGKTEITKELNNLESNKEYKVQITGTYDLDSNMGEPNYFENHNFLSEDEKIVSVQIKDFDMKDVKVTNVSREEKYAEITFKSTNSSYKNDSIGTYYVTHIKVEGIKGEIEVERIGETEGGYDTFKARIPYDTIDENHTYKIIGAKILSGKEFTSDKGFGTFELFKKKPTGRITSAKIAEGKNAGKIEVKYKIESGLDSIVSLKMKVLDKDGMEKSEEKIAIPKVENNEATVILEYIPKYAGTHTIQLILTGVNLNDGSTYGEMVLSENKEIIVPYKAEIVSTNMTVEETNETSEDNKITAAKGQNVNIDYEIKTNRPLTENLNNLKIKATGKDGKVYKIGENGKILLGSPIETNPEKETATYRVKVNVPEDAISSEDINYTVESVGFDTNEENTAKVADNTATIKVEKQVPEILSVTYDNSKRTVSIKVQDEDNAITNGKVVIKEGETPIITKTFGTNADENTKLEAINGVYNIVLQNQDNIEKKEYKVEVTGKYDIGKGPQDLKPLSANIKVYNGDYGFNLSDVRILKIENTESRKYVYINFKSKNNFDLPVKAVLVSEEEIADIETRKVAETRCDAEKVGDEYQIKIPFTDETPKKYTIKEAILENSVGFETHVEPVRVFKEAPIATNLSLDLKTKTASFAINDKDETITYDGNKPKAKAIIIDTKTNARVSEASINNLADRSVTFAKSVPHGTYKLAIEVSYDSLNGKGEVTKVIGETENTYEQKIEAQITKIETDGKKLFAKTDPITVTMHVTDNTDYKITKFYVHCKPESGEDIIFEDIPNYEEEPSLDGVYTFTTPFTPTTGETKVLPGIRTCTVEQIEYEDPENPDKPIKVDIKQTPESTAQVEILKDAPSLEWEKQEVNGKTNLIIKLHNPDNASIVHSAEKTNTQFEAGATIELLKLNPQTSEYENVDLANENKLIGIPEDRKEATRTIELTNNGTYYLKVNGTAYLADKLRENADLEIITKNLTLDQKEIKVVSDYDFKIQNERVVSVDRNANTATIEFESSNLSNDLIKNIKIEEETFEGENLSKVFAREEETDKGKVQVYKYTVTLHNILPDNKREISFRTATLANGKSFMDISNKITIYKNIPTASIDASINILEDEDVNDVDAKRGIKGTFSVTDADQTISKTYINVLKPDGTTLFTENKVQEVGDFDLSSSFVNQKGDYLVQIFADFDRNIGEPKTQEKIGEQKLTINVDANIIKNEAEDYYVEKGGEIKIHYTIEDNALGTDRFKPNGFNIVKTIDGKDSAEEFQTITFDGVGELGKENEEYYTLTLKAEEKPQTMEVKVKSISYVDTETETSAIATMNEKDEATTKIDVVKSPIEIKEYKFDGEQNLRFDLIDPDNAFKSGKVKITEEGTQNAIEDGEFEFNKDDYQDGTNTIKIKGEIPKLKDEQKYNIIIEAEYDRTIAQDEDLSKSGQNNKYKGTLKKEEQYHFIKDYEFKYLAPIQIDSVDEQNGKLKLSFGCTYIEDPELSLTHVYILDKFYPVTKMDQNRYQATIDFANTDKKLELRVKAVKFSNGRILKQTNSVGPELGENEGKVEPNLDNTDTVYAFLEKPSISEESAELNEENKVHVKFKLTDKDKTISAIKAQVFKGGSEITTVDTEKTIEVPSFNEDGTANIDFTIDKEYLDAGIYTVKVLFTYDRHGEKTHNDEPFENSIFELKCNTWAQIETDDRKGDSRFIARGEEGGKTKIPVTYTIKTNDSREIKAIKLKDNDQEIQVEKIAENQYKAIFEEDTKSGEKTYEVEKVVYEQETVSLQNNYTTTVEILKQAPIIEMGSYNQNDRNISFTVIDPEDTITSGRAIITSEDGGVIYKTVDINSTGTEQKQFTISLLTDDKGSDIPKTTPLLLKVIATYQLDQNGNKVENEKELAKQEIAKLSQDYKFDVQEVKVLSVDRENATAKLEIKVEDNSTEMGGEESQYLMQNFNVENIENAITVQKNSKDESTGITTYLADFSYPNDQDGIRQVYKINKVQIGTNSEEIEPKEFILFKTKPKTVNLQIDPNKITQNSATATFEIQDPDNALVSMKAGLYEYKYYQDYNQYMDIYMNEKEIQENETNSYEIALDGQEYSTNSKYTVKIEGEYDLADGNNVEKIEEGTSELIGEEKDATKQFSIPIHSKVEEIESTGGDVEEDNSIVVDKNKSISLYYRISDNTDLTIKKLVLTDKNNTVNPDNKTTWTATKVTTGDFKPEEGEAGDVYRITYGGKSLAANAGVQNLEIKEIQYDRSRTADIIEQKPQEFKVRKLIPTVTYAGKGTLETPQVEFNIKDEDGAIVDGNVNLEVYGTNDDVNNGTKVEKGKRYLENADIKVNVNEQTNIDFGNYGDLPDGTYDVILTGKYNLYDNDEKHNLEYKVTKNLTVVKGAYFTFENLNIYPNLLQEMGMLSGLVNIRSEKELHVKGIKIRFYKDQTDISDAPDTYVDYTVDESKIVNYGDDLYMIMDEGFLDSEAYKCIKIGQNPLKVLEVIATDGTGAEKIFKVNELSYANINRQQGQLAFFTIAEKTNVDKEAKTVSTDLVGYITVNDLQDFYVPGSLTACIYDENGELIAEQPIEKATEEEKEKLQAEYDEIDNRPISGNEKSDLKEALGYHRDIIFKNIPIAKSYRAEIHGKWYQKYMDSNLGYMEEVQEGIVKMKHRTGIGAEASPSVDAKLNLNASTRVGIEETNTYVKNENDEWVQSSYVEKGKDVKVEYRIKGNMDAGTHITSATINRQDVELSGVEGKVDVYETVIKAPETAGKFDIDLTRVGLNTKDYKFTVDSEEYILSTTPIDVLTETPKIDDFKLEYEENGNPRAIFNINEEKEEGQTNSKTVKKGTIDVYEYVSENNEDYKNIEPIKSYPFKTSQDIITLAQNIEMNGLNRSTKYWLQIKTDYSLVENEETDFDGITKVKDAILYSSPLMIQADDQIKITDLKAMPENIEKNQEIELNFNFSAGDTDFLKPVKLKVENNDVLFDVVQEDGKFKANVTGYSVSGKQTIKLEQIILNTGKVINLPKDDAHKVEVEICKDIVGVKYFSFTENGNEITLDVSLKDKEGTLIDEDGNVQIEVYEADSNTKIDKVTVEGSSTSLEYKAKFNANENVRKYKCVVKAKYSKLQDKSNPTTEEIYSREFSLDDRTIEIKDITNIELMKFENGVTRSVIGLTKEELDNGEQYLIRVSMSNASTFYSDISYYEEKDGKLVLTLNYVGATQYKNGEEGSITVELENSNTTVDYNNQQCKYYVSTNSFTGLMYLLRYNPSSEITLDNDIDAASYVGSTDDNVYVTTPFTGKINGNGHTIKNLQMPLFKEINGATIENLNFVNTVVIAKSSGIGLIANTASRATIKRINFSGVVFNVSNSCGTLFASAKDNTTIEECEVTGIVLTYTAYNNSHVGGMINEANGVTIKNCRVEGVLNGWPGWQCLAGVVANAKNVVLENCITNVDVSSAYGAQYSCGSMIGAGGSNLIMKNCVSISDGGNVSSMMRDGQGINEASTNNYGCSALPNRHNNSNAFKYQNKEAFTESFYKDILHLDTSIWNLTGCGGEILPKLQPANLDNKPTNKEVEIPGYERIKDQSGYEQSKEVLYHNLSKLAPYYDAKYIIEDAKDISNSDELNQKIIQGILPISKDGKIVNSLTSDTYQDIAKIKLVFKDKTIKEYNVEYETFFGNIVCYNIPDFHKVKYNFKNYVINKDANVVKELIEYVKNMNYVMSIDTLTKTKDSRLYSESFDDSSVREDKKYSTIFGEKTVKQEAEQVVIDLLSNNNYNITNDDVKTESVIKNELLSNKKLEKYLLTYTYVKRWYNIDVGEYNLKDILLYHSDIFEGELSYDSLTTMLTLNDSNISTSATHTFYANNIGKKIGLNEIGDFIEYFIKNTDKYKDRDVNDWLVENFNGFILETKLDNQDERLRYRAWDYLKCWSNTLLPVLRVPPKSTFIYSCPTQIHIGATRVYYADPKKSEEAMKKKLENFARSVKANYETIYGMIGGGSPDPEKQQKALDCFNRKNDIQTDTNIANDGEYIGGKYLSRRTWQYANQTQEDYHKWFAEATGIWTSKIGAAAYAFGTRIYWEDSAMLDNFKIWSHETMHDQDGALILKNNNRRPAVGGESYSDGFLTQGRDLVGYCKFNFVSDYASNTNATVNWSRDRISSPEKVEDYYDKAFQLNYFLDYLIGEAVIKLDKEQQEKVLSKMPETNTKPSRAGKEFEQIENIDDLIEGRYAIDYGAEGYRTIRWYNPLSDVNFTSLDNLWVMSYEMLGYGGYDNGWLLWTTDLLKDAKNDPYVSDQNAFKEITKRKNKGTPLTMIEYKKQRFKEAAENADKLLYLNKDNMINQFVETLKQDANDVKSNVGTIQQTKTSELKLKFFTQLKRYTDDLRTTPFGKQADNKEVTVNDGKEFIDAINNNSSAIIKLGNNIDLNEYKEGNSMIRSTFAGEIKGEGNKITGVNIPIFDSTLDAKFENFTIENPNISIEKVGLGALSNTTEKTNIKDVKVSGGTIDSKSKDTVGALVGQSQETSFEGCSVENTTVKGAKNVGALVGNATNVDGTEENKDKTAIIECYAYNANVEGTGKVGGLVGNIEKNTKIQRSSSLNVTVNGAQDSVGGLVGEINQGSIENSYSTGTVIGKKNYCGGLVGYAKDPEIKYCYTTCTVKGQSSIGGFIGTVRTSGKIESCISIAIMDRATDAKFDTGSDRNLVAKGFKNNYEIEEFIGKPASRNNVAVDNIVEIKYSSTTTEVRGIDDYEFWNADGIPAKKDYGVYFDKTIWKIPSKAELKAGELPTLQGKGNPKNTKVVNPKSIQTRSEQIN